MGEQVQDIFCSSSLDMDSKHTFRVVAQLWPTLSEFLTHILSSEVCEMIAFNPFKESGSVTKCFLAERSSMHCNS